MGFLSLEGSLAQTHLKSEDAACYARQHESAIGMVDGWVLAAENCWQDIVCPGPLRKTKDKEHTDVSTL
jgi:hypothetical protein